MKSIIILLTTTFSFVLFGQHEVGHTTITFNDAGRTGGFGSGGGPGRQIQTEVYYPADMAGTDVAATNGEFPVIVFGHGFSMSWDAYENIWEELVPRGFILAFPRTEGGFAPSHDEFGLDLALVEMQMQNENSNASSVLFEHITSNSIIMGHSMGGGATILAAANNSNIKAIIGLAPAETTPSAITAAANVSVPALIFSADGDAVTPAADHHTPIYNGLGSSCKYFVNILGGAHCYYANSNFSCDLGETASGGSITISRQDQHTIMFRYVIPWLNLYLKSDCAENQVFENDIMNDGAVTYLSSCTTTFPAIDVNLTVNGPLLTSDHIGGTYQWVDCNSSYSEIMGEQAQSFQATQNGNYAVIIEDGPCKDTSNCVQVTNLSLDQLNKKTDFLVYPNPSKGDITLETMTAGIIQIVSLDGKLIFEKDNHAGQTKLNLDLDEGIYILRYLSDDEHLIERLFISHKQ